MPLSKLLAFAAISILVALAWMAQPAALAHAQTPPTGQGKIEGQLVEGTKDVELSTTSVTVTLYMAPAGATATISQTTQTDPAGKFAFPNLDPISTTRYLLISNYKGVDYFSDILNFTPPQTTLPVSMTVFETTTDPSAIKISQAHFVFDIATRQFNVLQIVAVTNSTDRTYVGTQAAAGPHRTTLQLPVLPGAENVQFDNLAANDATIRGAEIMSYTLPFMPGDDQIVYNYTLPFNPPTYNFNVTMPFDVEKFRILLADVGGTIQSPQLSAPAPFPTQSGMKFLLSSADNIKAGTAVKADFVNLPATVAEPAPAGSANPAASAANNNLQLIGGVVLGLAAVAALGLLLYPVLRRRSARAAQAGQMADRRLELLQEMADLDDEFEAQKISETEYKETRARLKAELLDLDKGGDE